MKTNANITPTYTDIRLMLIIRNFSFSTAMAVVTSVCSFACFNALYAETQEIVIDAVVASVDGKPITIQDIASRLALPRELAIKDLQSDSESKAALEAIIFEKVILQEAETKKLGVSNSEIEEYINEVATRNNLSREAFELALKNENKNIEQYKSMLRVDILKSKLTSSYVRGTVSVSEEEIDAYIEEHHELSKSGSKVKLRQILVKKEGRSEEEALAIMRSIDEKLKSGLDFVELAREISEGSEAKDGGLLGVLPEEDLSRDIFDAIFALKSGDVSAITSTPLGYHIFKLEDRLVSDQKEDNQKVRDEVKKIIYDRKVQERMGSYFTNEIYKFHTVDRKI